MVAAVSKTNAFTHTFRAGSIERLKLFWGYHTRQLWICGALAVLLRSCTLDTRSFREKMSKISWHRLCKQGAYRQLRF